MNNSKHIWLAVTICTVVGCSSVDDHTCKNTTGTTTGTTGTTTGTTGTTTGTTGTTTSAKTVVIGTPIESLPLFPNSVVSNEIDFIQELDPSTYKCTEFTERSTQEMPGRDDDILLRDDVYVFKMRFTDGTEVNIHADERFTTIDEAQAEIAHFHGPLGKLPSFMRENLSHIILNIGDWGASAEKNANFFMVSTENMAVRRSNHDMEETFFHETVHAALDVEYAEKTDWKIAQLSDGNFITEYAESRISEDFSETALFYYANRYYPERLTDEIRDAMKEGLPNRLVYLDTIFPDKADLTEQVRSEQDCE